MTAGMSGTGEPPRRRIRIGAVAAALTGTLALLCCGGGSAAFFLTNLGGDQESLVSNEQQCDDEHQVNVTGKMPRMSVYGASQMRNAAIIIKVGQDMKVPPRDG